MTGEKKEHDEVQEPRRLSREYTLERRAVEGRIHDLSLAHYEKLAVLQAGIFALSVTFLAGLSSQATIHHVSILHLWLLKACWIAMPISILLCVVHNWSSTESFIALSSAWGLSDKKLLIKHLTSVPGASDLSHLDGMLCKSGLLDEWQGKTTQKSTWLYRIARCLEYAAHTTFMLGLFFLATFVFTNVKAFLP